MTNTASTTDADLADRARVGCRTAADALVRRHTGLVWQAILRYGRLPAAVEHADLLQAGSIAILNAARRWRPGRCKFSTYATAAVRNAIRNELRHASALPVTFDPADLDARTGREADDAAEERQACTVRRLTDALRFLTGEQRQLLFEVYGIGREAVPVREVARRLGRSYGTVSARLVRTLDLARRTGPAEPLPNAA